jgi:NADH-quinone oxidoreductase subunit D
MGFETVFHFVMRDREKILDLFELLAGARHSPSFLRPGGVAAEATEGFVERALEFCDLMQKRFKEYNDLFCFNEGIIHRTVGVGKLSREQVTGRGLTGPSARASGVSMDARVDLPYSAYSQVDFDIAVGPFSSGSTGDVHDRIVIRVREIAASLEIIRQVSDSLPKGRSNIPGDSLANLKMPAGEAISWVESSRGLLGCHVVSEGFAKPTRVAFRSPSLGAVSALSDVLVGQRIEDIAAIVASLDISMGEAER